MKKMEGKLMVRLEDIINIIPSDTEICIGDKCVGYACDMTHEYLQMEVISIVPFNPDYDTPAELCVTIE
jgi:hypothetical protein